MYHVDGQLVSCDPKARAALEAAVAAATGTRLTPRGQCQEYWVIGRREWPMLYFAERLAAASTPKEKPKGALSSELAALLVAASQPTARDVFLDPFAGSGAIVRARLRSPARKVIYSDIQLDAHRADVRGLAQQGCVALDDDALVVPSVASGSVDAIVTDPPGRNTAVLERRFPERDCDLMRQSKSSSTGTPPRLSEEPRLIRCCLDSTNDNDPVMVSPLGSRDD